MQFPGSRWYFAVAQINTCTNHEADDSGVKGRDVAKSLSTTEYTHYVLLFM